ncbi:copper chaperone PCu(A)C [Vibrio maerlii]|uniref:copper chaperone PCu(A)C n=1 Tax=Vibrio maerlii TaxID=2231648 RepID=UPI001F13A6BC|nr:copper chaperone PCu(A)C [Vibrio maerlii]
MTVKLNRFGSLALACVSLSGALFTTAAFANEHQHHHHKAMQQNTEIMVHDAYARATPPGAKTSAIFLTLMNQQDKDIALISASADIAGKTELHDVVIEGEVMKMRQIEQIDIAAQSHTELKPGSLHIMLFNLTQSLNEGENVQLTLNFDDGTTHQLTVPIMKAMNGMSKHSH